MIKEKELLEDINSYIDQYKSELAKQQAKSILNNLSFIYYKTKDDIFYNHLFDTLLFNDGSTISKDNFKVEFKNNNCILSLSGCEGSSSYLISFSENKVSYTDISGIQSN